MRLHRVEDADASIVRGEFDLFICASGYEARSTYLFEQVIGSPAHRSVLALGFAESCKPDWRARSDAVFAKNRVDVTLVGGHPELAIFETLGQVVPKGEHLRILIDYSSMPRLWINAIINFFKFGRNFADVFLYFSYTLGRHVGRDNVPEYPDSDYLISSIDSLTTLEGAAVRQHETLAVVGLGFEWIAPFAACELIEPDDVRVFYAEPGAMPDYGRRALDLNRLFLDEFSRDESAINLPVTSVEAVFRVIGELVSPVVSFRNVTLIPLGPKPHVLGCMLVANRLPEVTCIYVRGAREDVQQVEAVEGRDTVVTKVELCKGVEELSEG